MLDEVLLKLTIDGAVSFVMELIKRGFETKYLAHENKALVREARTLWKRKTQLEEALRAYNQMEEQLWIPAILARLSKPLNAETIRRRTRKDSALSGPFKTGQPTTAIAESAIKRHKTGILSTENRNRALAEIVSLLREHNLELARSVNAWDSLEQFYCRRIALLEIRGGKSPSILAIKRRLRKAARDAKLRGVVEGHLMTGKRAESLARAPSKIID